MTNPTLRLFDGGDETSPDLKPDVTALQNALNCLSTVSAQ